MTAHNTAEFRNDLTPETEAAWREFSETVFRAGALDTKTKQLIAVAVAHVTQCPDCINIHTQSARKEQASAQEVLEATWVAAEMRAGGAVAHSRHSLKLLNADSESSTDGSSSGS